MRFNGAMQPKSLLQFEGILPSCSPASEGAKFYFATGSKRVMPCAAS